MIGAALWTLAAVGLVWLALRYLQWIRAQDEEARRIMRAQDRLERELRQGRRSRETGRVR